GWEYYDSSQHETGPPRRIRPSNRAPPRRPRGSPRALRDHSTVVRLGDRKQLDPTGGIFADSAKAKCAGRIERARAAIANSWRVGRFPSEKRRAPRRDRPNSPRRAQRRAKEAATPSRAIQLP